MRFIEFLSEKTEKRKVIVVYGGGFQPFHAGHMSSYEEAKRKFPSAEFYVASSNDVKLRPIPFTDKKFLAEQAGVTDHFVQVIQPVNPKEILEKYDENKDILILVRSERDPVNYTKKDGSPAYYQPFKSLSECKPFNPKNGHGYIFVTKKKVFKIGNKEVYSGSQVREMYTKADDAERKNIIKDLYPRASNPQKVKRLLDKYIGGGIKESIDDWFEELLVEGVHDKAIFKAVFLGGGPGSGKDFVLSKTLEGQGLTEINSDKALEFLMDKNNLDMRMPASEKEARDVVRSKAKTMTELRQKLALLGRNGLIINGTGDDAEKIKKIKDRLDQLGYESSMIMVNTRDEISASRNVERGARGGRTVPEEIRKEKWDAVQKARPELAKLFGDNYSEFDNSEDLRSARPEVREQKEKELLELFKKTQKFVNKPPKNDMSKEWIANELEKKDTQPIPKGETGLQPHPDSGAAEEARRLGLQYYGFGRYGTKGKVTYRSIHDKLVQVNKAVNEHFDEQLNEDLRQWFDPNHPKGGWKRINSKGEAIGPCAREPGEAKPKCMSNEKRAALSKKERASAVRAKRKHDPNPERKGEPINVSNFGKGKISESYELSDSGALNILLLGNRVDEVDLAAYQGVVEEKKKDKYLKDTNGNVRVFMLRAAAAREAHQKNGTVYPYKNGYVIKINEEKSNELSTISERHIFNNENDRKTSVGRTNSTENGRITLSEVRTTSTRSNSDSRASTGASTETSGYESKTLTEETNTEKIGYKITLAEIRSRQKDKKINESIDKGTEPGVSMAGSGESIGRDMGEKIRKKDGKVTVAEMQGDETTASIGDKKEDELKKVGINLQSFKAKRPI